MHTKALLFYQYRIWININLRNGSEFNVENPPILFASFIKVLIFFKLFIFSCDITNFWFLSLSLFFGLLLCSFPPALSFSLSLILFLSLSISISLFLFYYLCLCLDAYTFVVNFHYHLIILSNDFISVSLENVLLSLFPLFKELL